MVSVWAEEEEEEKEEEGLVSSLVSNVTMCSLGTPSSAASTPTGAAPVPSCAYLPAARVARFPQNIPKFLQVAPDNRRDL